MLSRRIIFACVGVMGLATVVFASSLQQQEHSARDILKAVSIEMASIKTISYDAHQLLTSEQIIDGEKFSRILLGTVKCKKVADDKFIGGKVSIKCWIVKPESDEVRNFKIVYDGHVVTRVVTSYTDRIERESGDLNSKHKIFAGDGDSLFLKQFMDTIPFSKELNEGELHYEGEEIVGGVLCDIITIKRVGHPLTPKWFFAKEDRLPRRFVYQTRELHTGALIRLEVNLMNLRTNVEFKDSIFSID